MLQHVSSVQSSVDAPWCLLTHTGNSCNYVHASNSHHPIDLHVSTYVCTYVHSTLILLTLLLSSVLSFFIWVEHQFNPLSCYLTALTSNPTDLTALTSDPTDPTDLTSDPTDLGWHSSCLPCLYQMPVSHADEGELGGLWGDWGHHMVKMEMCSEVV